MGELPSSKVMMRIIKLTNGLLCDRHRSVIFFSKRRDNNKQIIHYGIIYLTIKLPRSKVHLNIIIGN